MSVANADALGRPHRSVFSFAKVRDHRIDHAKAKGDDAPMNIAQIEAAVRRGVPFRLKVADGDEYRVPHSDYIFLPPTSSPKRTYVYVHE